MAKDRKLYPARRWRPREKTDVYENGKVAPAGVSLADTKITIKDFALGRGAILLARAMREQRLPASIIALILNAAADHDNLAVRDLFESLLPDDQNLEHRFATSQIEGMFPQRTSLMPDRMLRDLSAQQAADLLAWLESLK